MRCNNRAIEVEAFLLVLLNHKFPCKSVEIGERFHLFELLQIAIS